MRDTSTIQPNPTKTGKALSYLGIATKLPADSSQNPTLRSSAKRLLIVVGWLTAIAGMSVPAFAFDTQAYFPISAGNVWGYSAASAPGRTTIASSQPGPSYHNSPTTFFTSLAFFGGAGSPGGYYLSQSAIQGTQLHYTDEDGQRAYWNGTCPIPFSNALTILPPDATVGQTVATTATQTCVDPQYGSLSVLYEYKTTVIGFETITIPLGTFNNALHVQIERKETAAPFGKSNVVTHKENFWFARDIGIIRADTVTELPILDENGRPSTRTEQVLLEFTNLQHGSNQQNDDGDTDCCSGDPINYGSGNHYQTEVDYQGNGLFPLKLERFYNSRAAKYGEFGLNWRHNYVGSVSIIQLAPPYYAWVFRPNGKMYGFKQSGNNWIGEGDAKGRLMTGTVLGKVTNIKYVTEQDEVESYDDSGRLLSISNRANLSHTFTYSGPSRIASIQDSFGAKLTFQYADPSDRVIGVTDPAGKQIVYDYDDLKRLTKVTYQDGSARKYNYNEAGNLAGADLPHALTSMRDENDDVYASWHYDSQGRAVSSEHADGAEKVSIAYNADGTRTIADSLGKSRDFSPQLILGVSKNTGLSEVCNSCWDGATAHKTYDANGNVSSRTDFNGNITTYTYDMTRHLETSRTEASGTPQARTISTQWDANYRLPLKIAEPGRLTTRTYDTSGNLLTVAVIATTDASGSQGFSAKTAGIARTWTYTYNQWGHILTATGPRTDIVDQTSYTYDSQGNLATITNTMGQVTTLSNYDAFGHAGQIVDPNGITTTLLYNPRGWLTSRSVSGGDLVQTTTYDYDAAGQLKLITLPDASTMAYTYDRAHRLTRITDSQGNSMIYTVDKLGNRTKEEVKDPTGALARRIARVYDAMNQLHSVTRGVQ